MTLDPRAAEVIEVLEAAFPDVEQVGAEEARRQMAVMLEALPTEPLEIAHVDDRAIPGPGGSLPVRVYRPGDREDLPVVVYLHGGGWAICDLETHDPTCRRLADAAGCVVMSVDYRLAPEHPFPAAVDDAYAALQWVAHHASELPGDGSRLGVAGDSAGGNLAAAACLRARDRGDPAVAAQLLVYPVIDRDFETPSYRDNAEGYFLTRSEMQWYWRHYLPEESSADDPYACPIRAGDLSGLPPAVVITAEHDPLRDEGAAYARRLEEAGVPVTYRCYEGMFHGFFAFPDALDAARDANELAARALREALGP